MEKPIRLILTLFFLTNINCSGQEKLGKAKIVDLTDYEKEDFYFPHDCSMESDVLDNTIELNKNGDSFTIKNIANDGFTGHILTIELNNDLDIIGVEYEEWTDVIDGSEMTFKADSVDLKLNANPFNSKELTGYYTLYMKNFFKAGEFLKKQGMKDEIFDKEFSGKFRTICNE
jgi:hypothetical protein